MNHNVINFADVMDLFSNTICAPATRSGGAIAVIRLSGDGAIAIADKVFTPKSGRGLAGAAGYSLHYGEIRDSSAESGQNSSGSSSAPGGRGQGELIDEVVVSVFRAPHSYTGEDSVEISCHGSEYIISRILELLVSNGAKMALPGEFTQRAFVAGKMDLSQAEAVADVIASRTAAAHRIAMSQLKGGFSGELAKMRAELLHIVSLMELELDFSEEDVEFADRSELRSLLDKTTGHISRLISSFKLGNAIKNGVPVAIAGAANAGKSTLLNAILGEERAIVSDIPGTTRDTVEETFNLDGVLFRFIDTAGLRETSDAIETLGVGRSYEKIAAASLVLAVADLTAPLAEIKASAADIAGRITSGQQLIFVLNKADVVPEETVRQAREAVRAAAVASLQTHKAVQAAAVADGRGRQEESQLGGGAVRDAEAGVAAGDRTAAIAAGRGRQDADARCFAISAKSRQGLAELLQSVSDTYRTIAHGTEGTLVTNLRHLDALKSALTPLLRVRDGLGTGSRSGSSSSAISVSRPVPTDLLAQDIREALYHLGSIVGEITTDEILGNIFKNFCIGK